MPTRAISTVAELLVDSRGNRPTVSAYMYMVQRQYNALVSTSAGRRDQHADVTE